MWEGEGAGHFYSCEQVGPVLIYGAPQAIAGQANKDQCGEETMATAFVALPKKTTLGGIETPCSKRYHQMILEGAKQAKLEPSYIQKLSELPVAPPAHGILMLSGRRLFASIAFTSKVCARARQELHPANPLALLAFGLKHTRDTYLDFGQAVLKCVQPFPSTIAKGAFLVVFMPHFLLGFILETCAMRRGV